MDNKNSLNSLDALKGLSDFQKQLDDCLGLTGLRDLQKQLDECTALSALSNLPRQFDNLKALSGLDDFQKQLNNCAALTGLSDAHKQIASISSGLAEAHRYIESGTILDSFNDVQKQLAGGGRFTPDFSALNDLNRWVREDQERWDTIRRSLNYLPRGEIEPPTLPTAIPNIAEQFQHALDARSDRDRDTQRRQFELLACIAEAGAGQNQTMAKIAELQQTLVREAQENTRIQKVVLYFAALSSALVLLALLFK